MRTFDASLGGLGGCPYAPGASGNVATEDVCDLFEREGIATGIDLDRAGRRLGVARARGTGRPLPGRVYGPAEPRASARRRARRAREARRGAAREARAHPRRRRARSTTRRRAARASSSAATAWRCCSTRAPSSRTARFANSTGAATCRPTASSPASAACDGRPVCVMANDSTVKAGSWGARTVEKILRIQETRGAPARPARLPGRLGRRAHHRPGRDVPGPARRRPHLPQPGAALGPGARRSACSSGPRPRAAPTSRPSATWSSWSRATPACTSARRAWPRW